MYLPTKSILAKVLNEISETELDIMNVFQKEDTVIIQIKLPNIDNKEKFNTPTIEIKRQQKDMTILELDIKYQIDDLIDIYQILEPLNNES